MPHTNIQTKLISHTMLTRWEDVLVGDWFTYHNTMFLKINDKFAFGLMLRTTDLFSPGEEVVVFTDVTVEGRY